MLALVAVGGFYIQYTLLSYDLKQAKLDLTSVNIELDKAKTDKTKAEIDIHELQVQFNNSQSQLKDTSSQLVLRQVELATAGRSLAGMKEEANKLSLRIATLTRDEKERLEKIALLPTRIEQIPAGLGGAELGESISGKVVDLEGNPILDVVLVEAIAQSKGVVIAQTRTNDMGEYILIFKSYNSAYNNRITLLFKRQGGVTNMLSGLNGKASQVINLGLP